MALLAPPRLQTTPLPLTVPQLSALTRAAILTIGGDLWYLFTATSTDVIVDVSVNNFSTFAAAVYLAGCTSTAEIDCDGTFGTGTFTLTGLTAGQQYLLRVYDFGNDDLGASEFCLLVPGPPPSNDDCNQAIPLFDPSGQPTAANGATYNTVNATASAVPGSCTTGGPDDDVWFSVDAQPGSTLTISVTGDASFDAVLGVHTGACSAVTSVSCVDNNASGGTETFTFTTSFSGRWHRPEYSSNNLPDPSVRLALTTTGANSGSTFTITATLSAPLPVELAHFSAKAEGKRNVITWTAATETDLSTYVVERATSALDQDFRSVAELAPRGTNGAEAVYTTYDDAPARVSYYRLRTVDLDGTIDYSSVVAVTRDAAVGGGIKLYPNPANAEANVRIDLGAFEVGDADVTITDAAGRRVTTVRYAVGATYDLPLAGLPAGMYQVSAVTAGGVYTERLVIE